MNDLPDDLPEEPIDARLVAFAHAELPPAERRDLAARLRRDPDARARLALLTATDALLGEALERDAAPPRIAAARTWWRPALAVAAALTVVALFAWRAGGHPDATDADPTPAPANGNDWLELGAAPRGGAAAPLFTDAELELHWQNRGAGEPRRPLRVVPFPIGATAAELAAQLDHDSRTGDGRTGDGRTPLLPLVLTAEITDPAGQVLQARWSPESAAAFEVAGTRRTQRVPLREFEVEPVGMRPVLIGGPGASEWRDDKNWQWTHLSPDRPARWFPELPGTYRIALRVESLPSPEFAPWPTFAPAVNVATAIVMTGEVGDWGEPHDGLRARLVWSTGASSIDRTPIALQLENHAGEAKRYNYAGSTIARIPQPQHFTLLVDGVEWTQNERVPVVLRAVDSLAPHPVGQRRTIVTRPGFWSADGQTLGASAGRHRIALVFHFRPSVWDTRDTSIWHGEIRTGELEVNVPD